MLGNQIINEMVIIDILPKQKNIELDLSKYHIICEEDEYYFSLTILNFNKSDSTVKLGFLRGKKNDTFFKPYFKSSNNWSSIPQPNKEKYFNLNWGLAIARIKK